MIIEIIKEMLRKAIKFIDENTKSILSITYLIIVSISILKCNDENRMLYFKVLIIIFLAFSLLNIIISETKVKIKKDQMPKERITKRNANGDIYIPENKLNQAIILLGTLEDDLYGKQ